MSALSSVPDWQYITPDKATQLLSNYKPQKITKTPEESHCFNGDIETSHHSWDNVTSIGRSNFPGHTPTCYKTKDPVTMIVSKAAIVFATAKSELSVRADKVYFVENPADKAPSVIFTVARDQYGPGGVYVASCESRTESMAGFVEEEARDCLGDVISQFNWTGANLDFYELNDEADTVVTGGGNGFKSWWLSVLGRGPISDNGADSEVATV